MDKRILTIQDISCVGQCSLTVALPVISACGIETAILPSSVLSNHTAKGFSAWTFCDLTDEMPKILEQWKKDSITFDAFYTGYVSKPQIAIILDIIKATSKREQSNDCIDYAEREQSRAKLKATRNDNALVIVDPVMADNGLLYKGFDEDFPQHMLNLCNNADVILPNITEAALMLNMPYVEKSHTKEYIEEMVTRLHQKGAKNVVLTGVSFNPEELGVACYDGKTISYYFNKRLDVSFHGTGDAYASAFTGALLRGKTLLEAASIAADFVVEAIKVTLKDGNHWYGVKFEQVLPYLINRL